MKPMKPVKRKPFWSVTPAVVLLAVVLLLTVGAMFFLNRPVFYIALGLAAAALVFTALRLHRMNRDIRRYLARVADGLDQTEQSALSAFPLPVTVCSAAGEVIWYNERFRSEVLDGIDVYGSPVTALTDGLTPSELTRKQSADAEYHGRKYTVFASRIPVRDADLTVLYYVEDTRLKDIAEEYALSRPAVILLYIDNMDELLQNARDSERAQLSGRVETLIEDWASSTTGVLRKYSSDRFLLLVEQRHLQPMIDSRFDILDRVRAVQTGDHQCVTLSIGVGQGETLRESEEMARQAIEMALGRGGDQAAVKTRNGFDFYGGVSKGVEKRTKVRTRVVASALLELVNGSDNVLVMGHRFSDLDCVGSAAAMASAVRSLGKPAYVVIRKAQTLAPELLDRYHDAGRADLFIEPEDALPLVTRRTLLIVTDTHNPRMLDSLKLYEAAATVVVIDHHRKMVDHIDNAVIFYHEPYSSSASEMVAELVQYLSGCVVSRLDAEALLAGIMLDTRSFVMKAGVRTFEAAAYLRRLGADTVEVKRLFAGSMDLYKEKTDIVAHAKLYGRAAIACDRDGGGKQMRIAASQAADELLYIKGVDASFVLFAENGGVNISARSLGEFNVQLVMEALGGGGHLTMAGAQLEETTMDEAYRRLTEAIDRQAGNQARRD